MSIVNSSTTRQPRPNSIGHPVEEVNQFTYLGAKYARMVAAMLMWIAESGRLRGPLEYCHLFGEIVHSQTAFKFAYLKAMTYQFCCLVQALGKSPNHIPPNFKSLWTVASEAFFIFILRILYLINWKCRIWSRLLWPLKGINGAALDIPCEKMSLQWPDKLCYGIFWMVLGEERGDPARRGDELWKGSAWI